MCRPGWFPSFCAKPNPCWEDGVCDDGEFCTLDLCSEGVDGPVCDHVDACEDANPCTIDFCHSEVEECEHLPVECDEALVCDRDTGDCVSAVLFTQEGGSQCYTATFAGAGNAEEIHPENGFLIDDGLNGVASGMRFPHWLTFTENHGNNPSGTEVAVWQTAERGAFGEITFDHPMASVSLFYASFGSVLLHAFDTAGELVASVVGSATDRGGRLTMWEPLVVDLGSEVIVRIRITGDGTFFGIDDVKACRVGGSDGDGIPKA